MARARRPPVLSRARAAFAKARLWIGFGGKKCGRQTEEKNGERGNGQREEKHHVIHSNRIQLRDALRDERAKRVYAPIGEEDAGSSSEHSEDCGFAEVWIRLPHASANLLIVKLLFYF